MHDPVNHPAHYTASGATQSPDRAACYGQLTPADDPVKEPVNDPVNHPSHYTAGGVECIDAIYAALCRYTDPVDAWLAGQVIKYLWRAPLKGTYAQDIHKAQFYLNRLAGGIEARDRSVAE